MTERNEKTLKSFVYYGLGFPITLENVLFHKIRGEWLPKIDVEALADKVFEELQHKPIELTEDEKEFMRIYKKVD